MSFNTQAQGRASGHIGMNPQAVLDFWFDGERERDEWFRKDAAFDAPIGERFGAAIEAGLARQRFGRFPHRNAILGRVSTAEEIEFLKTPGSGF